MEKNRMATASDIMKLIEARYPVKDYVLIPECKIGATWTSQRCSRFDAWIMARSWAHPRFIGCEVKVSRQDFLNDNKWQSYLPYCTEFYFVAAPGIIDPAEVPEQAGLLVASKNLKTLTLKKKAPVRKVDIPQSIFVYILMCRTKKTKDNTGRATVDLWRDRLTEMSEERKLGHDIAYHIRKLADKKIAETQKENRKLREENFLLQGVKDTIAELGITETDLQYGGVHKIKDAFTGAQQGLVGALKNIERTVSNALASINRTPGEE